MPVKKTPLLDAQPSGSGYVNPLYPIPEAELPGHEFELCDAEHYLFMEWAGEHTHISGVDVEFFHLDIANSTRDPLYDEAIERVFQGSYRLRVYVEYPESTVEAGEMGIKSDWSATMWIPASELIKYHAPIPAENDIFRVWDKDAQFYKKFGVLEQDIPESGYFFEITHVNEDGHLFDRAKFVGFKCDIKRRTQFTPERRATND